MHFFLKNEYAENRGDTMFQYVDFNSVFKKCSYGEAIIKGSSEYPLIAGKVSFYETREGVIVVSNISGLPVNDEKCRNRIFGFHIHSGESCTPTDGDAFKDALSHYNPSVCPHPYHAGDMPPLFGSSRGNAFLSFMTDRFNLCDIIGKAVIIHSMPDDFTTQPGGNSGERIACGIIQ